MRTLPFSDLTIYPRSLLSFECVHVGTCNMNPMISFDEVVMASFHLCVKNGGKGKAASHSAYIAREGKYGAGSKQEDLQLRQHGNLPAWAADKPANFWSAADKFERVNGTAYTEYELALPAELSIVQNVELVEEFIGQVVRTKPYEFAIHAPEAALGNVSQPHVHVMVNNRVPDGLDRPREQHFKRYNATNPELGGCKKDSGGRHRGEMKELAASIRKTWAELQNQHLEKHGHADRVDHRSNKDRGLNRVPERHLGHAKIKQMSEQDRNELLQQRVQGSQGRHIGC